MHKKNHTLLLILITTMIAAVFAVEISKPKKHQEIKIAWPKPLPEAKIPILMYHYVEYNQDERDFIRDSLNIPPHIFIAQIETLKNAGYMFITPKDLEGVLRHKTFVKNKYIILSFDDGYADFYTDVLPILKKYNVKAINYVVYNFIGRFNYMNKKQIEECRNSNLVEIGGHTLNHRWLKDLDKEIAVNEIEKSKELLENAFDIKVTSFAYPYGAYNNEVKNLVKKAEYKNAVTIEPGNMIGEKNMFELPRIRPGHNVGDDLIKIIEDI